MNEKEDIIAGQPVMMLVMQLEGKVRERDRQIEILKEENRELARYKVFVQEWFMQAGRVPGIWLGVVGGVMGSMVVGGIIWVIKEWVWKS